jgi:hypothetical protein
MCPLIFHPWEPFIRGRGFSEQIIRRIVSFFQEAVRRKLYINSRDKLRILVAPQPTDYQGLIFESADKLRIDMSEMSPAEKRDRLPEAIETLLAQVDELYEKAKANSQFVGADIWSFFRTNLEDYIAEPMDEADQVKNVLMILTDGYIDFRGPIQVTRPTEGNRTSYMLVNKFAGDLRSFDAGDHGLIPIRKDAFKNLEVLVLEMTERRIGDQAILEKYWAKWLAEMNVKRSSLKMTHDSPAEVGDIIERFLL